MWSVSRSSVMPILALIELVCKVLCVIHAIRTGRDRYWIWIIIFFPAIGCLVYFFVEIFPEYFEMFTRKKTVRRKRNISFLKDQVEISPSLKNKKALAEAYVNSGNFDAAIALFESCLTGIHTEDPFVIEGLSCAYFFKGDYENAQKSLIRLKALRGNEKKGDQFDLLMARIFEETGETKAAVEAYKELLPLFSGEEARVRYALLLKKMGKHDEANGYFAEVLKNVKLSPKYYRRTQKEWVRIAQKEMA